MIVVDAAVLVNFWLPGELTELAEAVKARDAEWAAPIVWRAEFTNVLAGCLRRGKLTEAEANAAFLNAQKDLGAHEFSVPVEQVLRLVLVSDGTAADCEYVALAQDLDVPLVTADPKMVRAFPKTAVSLEKFAKKK